MREIEETIIREYMYNDHWERMQQVTKNFRVARIYNIYISLALWLFSIYSLYLTINNTVWDVIVVALAGPGPLEVHNYPFTWFTVVTALLIAVLTILADVFLIKALSMAAFGVHFLTAAFAVMDLFTGFVPVGKADLIVLLIYSAIGMLTEDFAIRSYKELRYLAGQEGFPTFNFIVESTRHTKYAKFRDRWLKADKAQDYFTDNERPLTDYNVITAEVPSQMDGISVDDAKKDNWFEGKKTGVSASQGNMMDGITEEIKLPDDFVVTEEDERRIKRTLPPL